MTLHSKYIDIWSLCPYCSYDSFYNSFLSFYVNFYPFIQLDPFQFIPKILNGVEDRTLCRPVKFFYTKLFQPCLYGTWFCSLGQSCWNRKGPSPNCSHKMSQYFEALRFIFTGTKGKPNPRNTAQYHYPSSTKLCCLITLHNVIRQVTLYYLPILDLSIRLPNREARIFHLHRTGFYCSRVQ